MMRPLTVPSTVVNAMAEITANGNSPKLFASNGADMLELVTSKLPLTIAPLCESAIRT